MYIISQDNKKHRVPIPVAIDSQFEDIMSSDRLLDAVAVASQFEDTMATDRDVYAVAISGNNRVAIVAAGEGVFVMGRYNITDDFCVKYRSEEIMQMLGGNPGRHLSEWSNIAVNYNGNVFAIHLSSIGTLGIFFWSGEYIIRINDFKNLWGDSHISMTSSGNTVACITDKIYLYKCTKPYNVYEKSSQVLEPDYCCKCELINDNEMVSMGIDNVFRYFMRNGEGLFEEINHMDNVLDYVPNKGVNSSDYCVSIAVRENLCVIGSMYGDLVFFSKNGDRTCPYVMTQYVSSAHTNRCGSRTYIEGLYIMNDGRVVSGGCNRSIKVWDGTGTLLQEYAYTTDNEDDDYINTMAVTDDGLVMIGCSSENIFNYNNPTLLTRRLG